MQQRLTGGRHLEGGAAGRQWHTCCIRYAASAQLVCAPRPSVDIKRLEHLVQIAACGSFSKAAAVLGIAQPALGRQIRKLEDECGSPLLYRHGRGVSLTPEGERLLARVQPLLAEMGAALSELRAERDAPSGSVTLGLTPTLCRLIGAQLVTQARREAPAIGLTIVTAYSGYVHEWLTSARLDIAVLHDARRGQHLAMDPLGDLRLSLVSPRSLVADSEASRPIALADLHGLPLVLPTRNHGLRRTMEQAAARAGIALDVVYEMDGLELMLDLVQLGGVHTVLAAPVAQALVDAGAVVTRRIAAPEVVTRLMLAKASNRPSTRASQAIETMLKALVATVAEAT